jgi:hypothetical protein
VRFDAQLPAQLVQDRTLDDEDVLPYLGRRADRLEWLHAPAADALHPNRVWSSIDERARIDPSIQIVRSTPRDGLASRSTISAARTATGEDGRGTESAAGGRRASADPSATRRARAAPT